MKKNDQSFPKLSSESSSRPVVNINEGTGLYNSSSTPSIAQFPGNRAQRHSGDSKVADRREVKDKVTVSVANSADIVANDADASHTVTETVKLKDSLQQPRRVIDQQAIRNTQLLVNQSENQSRPRVKSANAASTKKESSFAGQRRGQRDGQPLRSQSGHQQNNTLTLKPNLKISEQNVPPLLTSLSTPYTNLNDVGLNNDKNVGTIQTAAESDGLVEIHSPVSRRNRREKDKGDNPKKFFNETFPVPSTVNKSGGSSSGGSARKDKSSVSFQSVDNASDKESALPGESLTKPLIHSRSNSMTSEDRDNSESPKNRGKIIIPPISLEAIADKSYGGHTYAAPIDRATSNPFASSGGSHNLGSSTDNVKEKALRNDKIINQKLQEAKAMDRNKKAKDGAVMHKFSLWNNAANAKSDDSHGKSNVMNDGQAELNTPTTKFPIAPSEDLDKTPLMSHSRKSPQKMDDVAHITKHNIAKLQEKGNFINEEYDDEDFEKESVGSKTRGEKVKTRIDHGRDQGQGHPGGMASNLRNIVGNAKQLPSPEKNSPKRSKKDGVIQTQELSSAAQDGYDGIEAQTISTARSAATGLSTDDSYMDEYDQHTVKSVEEEEQLREQLQATYDMNFKCKSSPQQIPALRSGVSHPSTKNSVGGLEDAVEREETDDPYERLPVSPTLSEMSQNSEDRSEGKGGRSPGGPRSYHSSNSNSNGTAAENNAGTLMVDTSGFRHESNTVKKAPSPLKWKRGALIGEGTFGRVYKGMNERTGELLAVKQLPIIDSSEGDVKGLQKEISVMYLLDHENIVRYLGTARSDRHFFIVLEYISGGSIANMLQQFGPFIEKLIRRFTSHILAGVEYLHTKSIIHRDIKGANVLVTNDGVAKLADFGCAKQLAGMCTASLEESLKAIRGSVPWMAPEVIKQSGHGIKSDIWSVGATVIEMGTGKPPWPEYTNNLAALFQIATSKHPPPPPEHLSKTCADFLARCMTIDEHERATAEELKENPFIISTSPMANAKGHDFALPSPLKDKSPRSISMTDDNGSNNGQQDRAVVSDGANTDKDEISPRTDAYESAKSAFENSKYISQIVYGDLDENDQLSVQSSMSLPQEKETS